MPIMICRICKKIRPNHTNDCSYVGALQYSDVTGSPPPMDPYRPLGEKEDPRSDEATWTAVFRRVVNELGTVADKPGVGRSIET